MDSKELKPHVEAVLAHANAIAAAAQTLARLTPDSILAWETARGTANSALRSILFATEPLAHEARELIEILREEG